MPRVEAVADPDDPRLADYRRLRDPGHRERVEAERGIFIAEGAHSIDALARSAYPVRSILLTEARLEALAGVVAGVECPVYVGPLDLLRAVAGFDLHRGAVAAGARVLLRPVDELVAGARRLAYLEGVTDHENLGALFRNAAAFGIDAVVLDPTSGDPLYRRSVRVSLGHVLHVPFTRARDITPLQAAGFTTVALTPGAGATPIDELAADPPPRVAFLLGAEGPGLAEATLATADVRVRIPVRDDVDSLNIATAAAIAFHRLDR